MVGHSQLTVADRPEVDPCLRAFFRKPPSRNGTQLGEKRFQEVKSLPNDPEPIRSVGTVKLTEMHGLLANGLSKNFTFLRTDFWQAVYQSRQGHKDTKKARFVRTGPLWGKQETVSRLLRRLLHQRARWELCQRSKSLRLWRFRWEGRPDQRAAGVLRHRSARFRSQPSPRCRRHQG